MQTYALQLGKCVKHTERRLFLVHCHHLAITLSGLSAISPISIPPQPGSQVRAGLVPGANCLVKANKLIKINWKGVPQCRHQTMSTKAAVPCTPPAPLHFDTERKIIHILYLDPLHFLKVYSFINILRPFYLNLYLKISVKPLYLWVYLIIIFVLLFDK